MSPSYPLLQGICSCKFFLHVSVQKIAKLKFLPLCRCPSGLNQNPEGTVKLRILPKAVAHPGNLLWVWTLHHLNIGECCGYHLWSCWFRKLQYNLGGYPEHPICKFSKEMRLYQDSKTRDPCHCSYMPPEQLKPTLALACFLFSLFSPSFSPSLISSFHWKKRANYFLGVKNKLVSYTCLQFANGHTEYFLSPWVIIHVISRLGFVEIFESPGAPSRAHVIAWIQQYSSFSPLPLHPHSWGVSALW